MRRGPGLIELNSVSTAPEPRPVVQVRGKKARAASHAPNGVPEIVSRLLHGRLYAAFHGRTRIPREMEIFSRCYNYELFAFTSYARAALTEASAACDALRLWAERDKEDAFFRPVLELPVP